MEQFSAYYIGHSLRFIHSFLPWDLMRFLDWMRLYPENFGSSANTAKTAGGRRARRGAAEQQAPLAAGRAAP
eukprot:COSAG01_NODE_27880_length_674_cov_1.408696_1_plen_71_part_01